MPSQKNYTITEVAEELGVSPATVSRAMNNTPGVSKALRDKILRFVEEVGYRPNSIAQSLSRGRSNMIALILGDIRNPFYADLAFHIQKNLEEHAFVVTTLNSEYDYRKELQFIELASSNHYGGIILVTVNSEQANKYINTIDMPVLLVNRVTEDYHGPFVVTDNFQAGYIAARHLINLGHKDIGFLSGHHKSSSASYQRFIGYKQALNNYCLTFNERFCSFDLNWNMDTGFAAAKKIFENTTSSQRPSAYLMANDLLALGFMDYCEIHSIHIPDDLSIISFDDIDYSALHRIQLTTVSQHADKIAESASQIMVELLTDPPESPRRKIIEPTLIVRNTTKQFTE